MEKAKLTKAQADAVRKFMKLGGESLAVQIFCDYLRQDRKWTDSDFVALNELDADTFFRSVYVGYEIYVPDQNVIVTKEMIEILLGVYDIADSETQSGMRLVLETFGVTIEGIEEGES